MARCLHAYLDPDRMPEREPLQAALRKLGHRFVLDDAWAAFGPSGYLPCTLEGEDAGVYLRFERDAPMPEAAPPELQAQQNRRTALVQLRWSGDRREELSATLIAAALLEGFDALVVEPERGVRKSLSGLKAHARELLEGTF